MQPPAVAALSAVAPAMPAFLPPAALRAPPRPCARARARAPPRAVFGLSRAERRARADAARRALWERVAALRQDEAAAVAAERFHDAARLRDRADALRAKDPHVRLRARLDAAVAAQRFRAAARLRDAMSEVSPPPIILSGSDVDFGAWRSIALKRVRSCKLTNDICVEVESFYDVDRSGRQQLGKIAVFGVRIRVRNDGDQIVQLVGRKFAIESFVMHDVKNVEGWGVGGDRKQPVLEPGEEFIFETAVPITLFGLVPVPYEPRDEDALTLGSAEGQHVVVGALSGAMEFCSGSVGEEVWEAHVGECFLVLPG